MLFFYTSSAQCSESDKKCHLWTAVDLGFFILMGIVGGLLGATFNCLNKRLAKYRMRNVHPKPKLVRYVCSLEFVQGSLLPKQKHQSGRPCEYGWRKSQTGYFKNSKMKPP